MKNQKKIKASELEKKFDAGEDMSEHFDMNAGVKTVNVDLPIWAIKALDQEATRRGVARQALMKMWLVDRLDEIKKSKKDGAA